MQRGAAAVGSEWRAHFSSNIFFTSLRTFCFAVRLPPETRSAVTSDLSSTSSAYRVGIKWL